MARRAALLVALVALAVPAAASAKKGPALKPFPHPEVHVDHGRPVLSDGSRYFVINAALGTIRVYDTRTAQAHDVDVPDECKAVAATLGRALVACRNFDREDPTPYVLRLSDRHLYVPPGADRAGAVWSGIGRHWLVGRAGDSVGKPTALWLNWRTGKQRLDDYQSPTIRDLDDPKLRVVPDGFLARTGSLSIRIAGDDSLMLGRPGPDARLSRCTEAFGEWGCGPVNLSAGIVSWLEGTAVRTYDARRRLRLGWYLDGYEPGLPHNVVHTRDHLLVFAVRPPNSADLLWARLPR
jgi:hypothetical protein